jgi:acylphosphatase
LDKAGQVTGEKIARSYLVRGRVQGVGFRYFVEQAANALGIHGYVRNLDDGRVEVYAVGLPEQLSELAGILWKGPRMAIVRGIDEDEAPVQKIHGFTARH